MEINFNFGGCRVGGGGGCGGWGLGLGGVGVGGVGGKECVYCSKLNEALRFVFSYETLASYNLLQKLHLTDLVDRRMQDYCTAFYCRL